MVLFEDARMDYGEQRMIGISLLETLVVLIVHVETDDTLRSVSSPCARPTVMKPISTTAMPDTSDDAPPLTQADFDQARFMVAGQAVSKPEWQTAVRVKTGKQRINIMLDVPIVEHFKTLAGERGYQTLINETLRRAVVGEQLEANLRMIIREELHSAK